MKVLDKLFNIPDISDDYLRTNKIVVSQVGIIMTLRQAFFRLLNRRPVYQVSRVRPLSTQTAQQESTSESKKQTHFGFEVVDEEEKSKKG